MVHGLETARGREGREGWRWAGSVAQGRAASATPPSPLPSRAVAPGGAFEETGMARTYDVRHRPVREQGKAKDGCAGAVWPQAASSSSTRSPSPAPPASNFERPAPDGHLAQRPDLSPFLPAPLARSFPQRPSPAVSADHRPSLCRSPLPLANISSFSSTPSLLFRRNPSSRMPPTLLPLNSSAGASSSATSAGGSAMRLVGGGGGEFGFSTLRKLTKVGRMDFELAAWQLSYLVISPRRVCVAPAPPPRAP